MNMHPSWEAKPASIRFALASQYRATEFRNAAMKLLDRLQFLPADQQISVAFIAAVILANAAGLDAHDLVTRAKRMVADAENETLRALGDYAKGELR